MCQGYWYNVVKVTEIMCTNIYDDIPLNKCHNFNRSIRVFDEIQPCASSRKTVCYNMTDLQHTRTCSIHSVILLTTETVFIITDAVIIVIKIPKYKYIYILCICHQSQILWTRN